jgi:hypothetical protein
VYQPVLFKDPDRPPEEAAVRFRQRAGQLVERVPSVEVRDQPLQELVQALAAHPVCAGTGSEVDALLKR